jgi:hypothetical protein
MLNISVKVITKREGNDKRKSQMHRRNASYERTTTGTTGTTENTENTENQTTNAMPVISTKPRCTEAKAIFVICG